MTGRAFLFAGLVPAALGGTACDIGVSAGGLEGAFDRDLAVTGPVEVDVRTGSGDVMIRPGADGTVHVHGRIRTSMGWVSLNGGSAADRIHEIESNPPIEQSGNAIRIGDRTRGSGWNGMSVSYEIVVPVRTRVKAGSGSGDLTVGEIAGPVDVSTGSGDVRLTRIAGAVDAHSGSGDIEVEAAQSVVASTGSGNVRAGAVRGSVNAHSGSGDVSIRQDGDGRADIDTGSGSITLTGARGAARLRASSGNISVEGTPKADWELHASSGDVRLRVSPESAFDLVVHSSSGRIDNTHPVTTTGEVSRRELRGRVRSGGPRVEIGTSSGDIEIR